MQVVRYAFTSMSSRMNGALAKDLNASYEFDCNSVRWYVGLKLTIGWNDNGP